MGMYVMATVDVEDTDAVVEAYIERLLELQTDEGLAVYVVPVRIPAKIISHSARLHYYCSLSDRDVAKLRVERDVTLSHEAVPYCNRTFGQP